MQRGVDRKPSDAEGTDRQQDRSDQAHHHVVDEEGMPAAGVGHRLHDDPARIRRRPRSVRIVDPWLLQRSSCHEMRLPRRGAHHWRTTGNNVHMSMRELSAAGITDPGLQASHLRCRGSMLSTGRPTSWPPDCCRQTNARSFTPSTAWRGTPTRSWTGSTPDSPRKQRADALDRWSEVFLADLQRGHSADPVAAAAVDTAVRWSIPIEHFEAFFHSMRMDLTVEQYRTHDDLGTNTSTGRRR